MQLTLGEFLALPVLAAARPEILNGHDSVNRPVRWVHTSEVSDIGPLLQGGEVLLTTGLGLVGLKEPALRSYVQDLANRGVTALAIELGRTFPVLPAVVEEAARSSGLPLIVFHGVVPFIRVTETVHRLLISGAADELARDDETSRLLQRMIMDGCTIADLVEQIARARSAPVRFVATDGRQVASSAPEITDWAASTTFPVLLRRAEVGSLEAFLAPTDGTDSFLERCATAIALSLALSGDVLGVEGEAVFLDDLLTSKPDQDQQFNSRASLLGFRPAQGSGLVGIAVGLPGDVPRRVAEQMARLAARRVFHQCLIGLSGSELLAVATITAGSRLAAQLERLVRELEHSLGPAAGHRTLGVVAGPVVREVPALRGSLHVAVEARRIASRLGIERRVRLSSQVSIHRLIAGLVDNPELGQFIEEQLGSVLGYDAAHGHELLHTLAVYIECEQNKTLAARKLGIRRQTLYQRLERLDELTEDALRDPDGRTSLTLALLAWRIRNAGTAAPWAVRARQE